MNEPYHPPQETWPPPVYAPHPPGLPYDRDGDHLRQLSICYYIWGALTLVFACFFLLYLFIGLTMLSQHGLTPLPPGSRMPPNMPTAGIMKSTGWMFVAIGGGGTAYGWLLGILTIYAGRCLARHKHPLLITIVAALNCLSIPIGTVLGVFTFVVTARPTVKMLFNASDSH